MSIINEHDRVVLTVDLPERHLKAGDVGTVVHIYNNARAYEVEFFTMDGNTLDVATAEANQIQLLTGEEYVLHVRPIKP